MLLLFIGDVMMEKEPVMVSALMGRMSVCLLHIPVTQGFTGISPGRQTQHAHIWAPVQSLYGLRDVPIRGTKQI